MDPREELAALRRLAELEAKAQGSAAPRAAPPAPTPAPSYDPLEGMGWGERMAASAGAGLTDLWQGGKQRYAEAFGSDDDKRRVAAEVAEKRARDEKLVEGTTGGGIARAVGQAAPMLLIPGGQSVAAQAALGAAGGALSGALQPTQEGESVAVNALMGGTVGAALPLAVRGAQAAYRAVAPGAGRRAAAEAVTERIAQRTPGRTGAQVADVLAPPGAAPAGAARGRIPQTAAQQSGDNALAEAELVSRMRNRPQWRDFDEQQARAVAEVVQEATRAADDLAPRMAARQEAFQRGWQGVEEAINPEVYAANRDQLRRLVDDLAMAPESVQPEVRAALREVASELERYGDNFSPAHMQQLRANFAGATNPGMGANPYQAAPRSARPIIDLKRDLDRILDESSGGAWSPVVQGYREASGGVRQAQAARAVRDTFFDPETGLARKTAADMAGEVPEITEAGMQRALEKARNQRTGRTLLDDESHTVLQQTLDALRAKNNIQRLQKSATGGGGSATAPNAVSLVRAGLASDIGNRVADAVPFGNALRGGAQALRNIGTFQQSAAELAALQNPQAMADLLRQGARNAQGYDVQALLAELIRRGGVVGGSQYLARPETAGADY